MKQPGLIAAFGLILTLLPRTNGQGWAINVTRHIHSTRGSNVTILCSFTSPLDLNTGNVKVFWEKSTKTYVFHANDTYVLETYRGRTRLAGITTQGNCSLVIQNIREEEQHIYLRVNVNGKEYSFKNNSVSITLSAASQEWTITITCVAVLVPVAVLAILLTGGTLLRRKGKRNMALTRQESGHYANFSRTLSNRSKRGDTSQKEEKKMFSDEKEINEPIYINMEAKV